VDVNIAYNLPVFLRNFYYKQLVDIKDKENKSYDKSSKPPTKPKIDKPF
jgi:hypothetical protein